MAAITGERKSRTAPARRPAADLIEAVVHNMRQNLEELRYTIVAPSRYTVYLSPSEHRRLEGILPRLRSETIRALTEEIDRLNNGKRLRRRVEGWLGRSRPALQNADNQWHVEFLSDVDGELQEEQDIVVHSDLILPEGPELGGGAATRRVITVHSDQRTTTKEQTVQTTAPAAVATASPVLPAGRPVPSAMTPPPFARVSYTDARGDHRLDLTRESTSIGRGGIAFPVDIRIVSSEDVSREHARIRRDAATGACFLIDLSSLGTTIDGRHVPRGFDDVEGAKRENGAESELKERARIGLAETVFLNFEKVR